MIAIFLGLASISKAEDITVRVISAKNGRPIVEAHVQLFIAQPGAPLKVILNRWQYTDASGSAIFHVDAPIPLNASLGVGGMKDFCAPATYRAKEVLQTGVAIADTKVCPHRPVKKFLVHPHPGEIVVYDPQYSRWERTLYFPWAS
jgi:hypothetical protein